MANFEDAYKKLLIKEGGYVHDSDDSGGETYRGISRRYNPTWEGWDIIDTYKRKYGGKSLKKKIESDDKLEDLAAKLYKEKYWDVFELDNVPSQGVAFQMFDTNVNCGNAAAIRFAERCLDRNITGRWTLSLLNDLVSIKA